MRTSRPKNPTSTLAFQQRQLRHHIFPLIRICRSRFAFGDAFPAGFLRQLNVELDEVHLVGWRVFFGIDRVDGAFWDADCAVDAFIGVDDQHVGAFAKAVDGAYIDAVGVFAFDTGFGNDVGHFLALNLKQV